MSVEDNVTLMRFIERMNENANIVGICMGDAGIISRVLGLRAGSAPAPTQAIRRADDRPRPDPSPPPLPRRPHGLPGSRAAAN